MTWSADSELLEDSLVVCESSSLDTIGCLSDGTMLLLMSDSGCRATGVDLSISSQTVSLNPHTVVLA